MPNQSDNLCRAGLRDAHLSAICIGLPSLCRAKMVRLPSKASGSKFSYQHASRFVASHYDNTSQLRSTANRSAPARLPGQENGGLLLNGKKSHAYPGIVFTLTDAAMEAARLLDLDAMTMAAVLQTDLDSVAALYSGHRTLTPGRQDEWQHAMDVVRLYCILETMNKNNDLGGHWLRQPHALLQERPIDTLLKTNGLRQVLDCLQQSECSKFDIMQTTGRPDRAA